MSNIVVSRNLYDHLKKTNDNVTNLIIKRIHDTSNNDLFADMIYDNVNYSYKKDMSLKDSIMELRDKKFINIDNIKQKNYEVGVKEKNQDNTYKIDKIIEYLIPENLYFYIDSILGLLLENNYLGEFEILFIDDIDIYTKNLVYVKLNIKDISNWCFIKNICANIEISILEKVTKTNLFYQKNKSWF